MKDKNLIDSLIDKDILINKDFFYDKYNKYLKDSEDCGQYLWNEIILNLTLQNLKNIKSI